TLRVGAVRPQPEPAVAEPVLELRSDDPAGPERQVGRPVEQEEAIDDESVVIDEVVIEEEVIEAEVAVVVQVTEPDAAAIDAEGASVVLSGDGRDGQRQEDRRGRGRPEE